MTASDFTAIDYVVADNIATITLNSPKARNAFNTAMCLELVDAFDLTDADDDVRAVIVTGAGKHFCVGADLGEGFVDEAAAKSPELQAYMSRLGTIGGVPRDGGGYVSMRIARSTKPVIAAINGTAVGVGVTMTLPMDIRIVGEASRLGLIFARRGLVPEAASSWFLPRLVGISKAMEWVATGRIMDAPEALAGGLVSYMVPDADILTKARGIAREIVENTSPVAVAVARQMLWGMLSAPSPWDAHALDSQAIYGLAGQPDVAEGVASFLEKRQADFPMSVGEDFPDYVPRWPSRPAELGE